ncbi:MAG: hypothetical protein ACXV3S_08645, partial [Kineosporiaceae bacterium]
TTEPAALPGVSGAGRSALAGSSVPPTISFAAAASGGFVQELNGAPGAAPRSDADTPDADTPEADLPEATAPAAEPADEVEDAKAIEGPATIPPSTSAAPTATSRPRRRPGLMP